MFVEGMRSGDVISPIPGRPAVARLYRTRVPLGNRIVSRTAGRLGNPYVRCAAAALGIRPPRDVKCTSGRSPLRISNRARVPGTNRKTVRSRLSVATRAR
jgi:hypothetical protein